MSGVVLVKPNIGAYPRIVKEREVQEKRFSKQTATLVAAVFDGRLARLRVLVPPPPPSHED